MIKRYRIGIDIGGTFTDIVVFDKKIGDIVKYLKIETTPKQPENAVITGLRQILNRSASEVEMIIHATTIATNALLGQVGLELPKTALITTKGFRDIIEIGRQRRSELYNFFVTRPVILVPRRYRFEVDERVNYLGEILKPLNEDEVNEIVNKLVSEKIESVAVSLLHSYANPKHEQRICEIIEKRIKNVYISLSSEVDPEHREYERTSTTVVNAVLKPIVSRYLRKLTETIQSIANAPIRIMQSSGGIASTETIIKLPVCIIESGPASGVLASLFLGDQINEKNLLSFDMGGTTAKAGTIINGKPLIVTEYEVGGKVHAGRILKGSGYPVRFPFIDLAEISAGGGSIIWVDEGGALRVGPISAGALPGPACYGKGGEKPTITDANLLLGRLNPKYLLGGFMKIYKNLAKKAFREKISQFLNIDEIEAALGAIKIANSLMSKIMRIVSIERGIDPRDLKLVAFGGAGPMHACALAEELELKGIIIPKNPGLFSAIGLLAVDFKHTFVKSIRKNADEVSFEELEKTFLDLEEKGFRVLEREGIPSDKISFKRYVDMRYWGQGYELIVPCEELKSEEDITTLINTFHKVHEARYGYSMMEELVEIVNIRLEAIGIVDKPRFQKIKTRKRSIEETIIEYRDVFFEYENDFIKTPVHSREKLYPGFIIEGPAIIEQYDSTTVVYPKWIAKIDDYGNILLERE